jgi:F-type H+-transporting ATPase subunit a
MALGYCLGSSNPLTHVVAHDVFTIRSLGITVNNHMIMMAIAGGIMLVLFPLVMRRRELVPSGVQNFFEAICVYFRDEVAKPMLQGEADRFMGLIWTMFFFILFCNLLGMVPMASVLYLISGGHLQEVGGTATGNLYVTGALAAMVLIMIHLFGIQQNVRHERHHHRSWPAAVLRGTGLYFYKMVPHIEGTLGLVLFVPLLGLELLGLFVRSVALAIRLFANMIAGHILLAVLLLFITMAPSVALKVIVAGVSVLGSVAISLLELFVALLQAYIFTFLATIFIGMAVHQEH